MDRETIIDDSLVKSKKRRRELLPWWIKGFSWFFMLFGILAVVCLFLGFTTIKPTLSFFGFETNEPFSAIGALIISLGVLNGITAYMLWFEKKIAIKLAKATAIIGILVCSTSMIIIPLLNEGLNVRFRLELILLFPFLLKLHKIEVEWESL